MGAPPSIGGKWQWRDSAGKVHEFKIEEIRTISQQKLNFDFQGAQYTWH